MESCPGALGHGDHFASKKIGFAVPDFDCIHDSWGFSEHAVLAHIESLQQRSIQD